MTKDNRAYKFANEHAYEYVESEWDIIPPTYGKKERTLRPRLMENVQIVEKVHPENLKMRRKAVGLCCMILVCFLLMTGVVYSYAALSEVNLQANDHMANIEELSAQVEDLEVRIAGARNINEVQQKAKLMGMDFAATSQIEYIDLGAIG